jgi:hypothetical protein
VFLIVEELMIENKFVVSRKSRRIDKAQSLEVDESQSSNGSSETPDNFLSRPRKER